MKNILKIAVLAVIVTSCKKEFVDQRENATSPFEKTVSIKEAENFYYSHGISKIELGKVMQGISVSQTSSKRSRIAILPLWKKARQSKEKDLSYLEVPINNFGFLSLPAAESRKYTQDQKKSIFKNTKTFLIYFRDEQDNLTERIVSYIPDITYVNKGANKLTVEELTKDFTGRIEYRNIYGEKIFDRFMKDGVIIKTNTFLKAANKGNKSGGNNTSGIYCVEVITDWYVYGCYNYYPDGANGEEIEVCGIVIPDGTSTDLVCEQTFDGIDCDQPANFFTAACFYLDADGVPAPTKTPNPTYPLNANGQYISGETLSAFELDYRSRMTLTELAYFDAMTPTDRFNYLINAYFAETIAAQRYHDASNGGKQDAMRHSVLHGQSTLNLGLAQSREMGTRHEDSPIQNLQSYIMDMHNNEAGRQAALAGKADADEHNRPFLAMDLAYILDGLMAQGALLYIKDGVAVPTNQ